MVANYQYDLEMKTTLQQLEPKQPLGPRSICLPGTRARTISLILSWIMECNGGILWLSGLAGTGKSSIMGSIVDHAHDMDGRSHLGAFIRFDRVQMNDPSNFITSLAYHLGLFDTDIGKEVADVLKQRPDIARYPFMRQFDKLIIKPLKAVARLTDVGPLVVLVDGIDECERSDK
jgi:hypothetical protein